MYVLHVVSDLDESYGGPSQSVPQLVRHLRDEGVDGRIVFVETLEKSRNRIVETHGLDVRSARLTGSPKIYYARDFDGVLAETFASHRPDIVHIHSMWRYPAWAAWRRAKAAGVPVVVSPRSNLYTHSLRKSRWVKRTARALFVDRMLREAAFVHSTADSETEAVRVAGYGATPIRTIPNGIEAIELSDYSDRSAALQVLGMKTDPTRPHLLFLSRVDPRKRVADLIEAFGRSAEAGARNAELMIAGPASDSYAAELAEAAQAAGVAERVHFLGMLRGDQRVAAYAAADLFVLPTQFENFGIAIGEALSAGLPTVTTTETPWESIPANGAGHLVKPGDIEGLTRGIDDILRADPEARTRMAEGARQSALPFIWPEIGRDMAEAYRSALRPATATSSAKEVHP